MANSIKGFKVICGSTMRFSKNSRSKKGVMGIETLIIFIAMILVAAVAAGVMLKTSGLLQQRALAVGTEATERIVTGFEVASVTANVNTTENSFNEMEVLIRLQAGSYDMNLLSLSYIIKTQDFNFQADMMETDADGFLNRSISFMNGSWTNIGNIDLDPDDTDDDYARLVFNVTGNTDYLEFNLSTGSVFNMSLGQDVENGTVNIRDRVIEDVAETSQYDYQYGFFTYVTDSATAGAINTTSTSSSAWITNAPADDGCTFEELIPNYKFCTVSKIGDGDEVLEQGELVALRYKLSSDLTRTGDEDIDLQFIPKRGAIIDVAMYVPEVLSRTIITLWP